MGYDVNCFIDKDIRYSCTICLDVPKNASALPCGHQFCHECVEKCVTLNPKCPTCRVVSTLDMIAPSYSVRLEIQALRVRCKYAECDFTNTLRRIEEHEKGCLMVADPEIQCNMASSYENGENGMGKNIERTFLLYQKAAEQHFSIGEIGLGMCYEYGKGVEKDERNAFEMYMRAAKREYPKAEYYVGLCYEHGVGVEKDMVIAVLWYQKSASHEYAEAQASLGVCYETGVGGVEIDLDMAFLMYKQAVDQKSSPNAHYLLGLCYENGKGVEKDPFKAFRLYLISARNGYSPAYLAMGSCYHKGHGVTKNIVEAYDWYTKAKKEKNCSNIPIFSDRELIDLGIAFECGKYGAAQNLSLSFSLYKEAADHGCATAEFYVGLCYADGIGVGQKDEKEALIWIRKAVSKGLHDAENYLGSRYFTGAHFVEKDISKAIELYKTAADCGYHKAQYNLGTCYENGVGVEKDNRKAMFWYEKAALQGHGPGEERRCALLRKERSSCILM